MKKMHTMAGMTGLLACLALAGQTAAPPPEVTHGYRAAPQGAQVLSAPLPEDSIHLFKDKGFEGNETAVMGVTLSNKPGTALELPDGMNDDLSALRWNLPAGVAVVFYEDEGGKGEQLIIWGKGQVETVEAWDINDKISRWAWFNVGGNAAPPSHFPAEVSIGPLNARTLSTTLPLNALEFYKDKNFGSNKESVGLVTGEEAGKLHTLKGAISDSLSSLRWNLPPGVVVVFYQDASGLKQQASIWGKGEIADVDLWDFNDKVSRWAWFYIGSPPATTKPAPTQP